MSTSIDPFVGRHTAFSDLIAALDHAVFLLETIKTSVGHASHLTDAANGSTRTRSNSLIPLPIEVTGKPGESSLRWRAGEQPGTAPSDNGYTSTDPAGLTGREREVIKLVADGLSNAHIAEELFISTNTVARHIAGIFAKTESENRVQAANYAREHGLLD